ncbi:aspartate carbamoyltransferase catalytic subunit [Dissulfurirhabdus thermomarina]|uniref:aspartate carbamoyltransferase catalytic subunit n=1 Tax=Dissulfurirhabdus thermomarina TaxID=1765737 RepID=UPI002852E3BA|nr:aspartate carbamoyltransferase catalytic subunit [Dissulfurirhabdus thermomarina]
MNPFGHRHILGISQLAPGDITTILDTADSLKEILDRPIKKVPPLRGRTVVHLFLEPSTRTRLSFEMAAKRLSADTVGISAATSSLVKGETLVDTARNIEAMRPDVLVLRHPASGAPHLMARHVDAAVINAGDGTNEHPTQALLDLMTVRERLGRLQGLRVAIVGDIAHSRVARSDILAFSKMGAEVVICGPATLLPPDPAALGARVTLRMEEALEGADVVIMLRIQRERMGQNLLPSLREYAARYGLDRRRAALAKPGALVLHPGPLNRGVEISPEVADGPCSVILDQVTNGVAVRMALLSLLVREG